jgi:hypothetical protein
MLVSLQDHTYPKIHHETITAEGGIQDYFAHYAIFSNIFNPEIFGEIFFLWGM